MQGESIAKTDWLKEAAFPSQYNRLVPLCCLRKFDLYARGLQSCCRTMFLLLICLLISFDLYGIRAIKAINPVNDFHEHCRHSFSFASFAQERGLARTQAEHPILHTASFSGPAQDVAEKRSLEMADATFLLNQTGRTLERRWLCHTANQSVLVDDEVYDRLNDKAADGDCQ